MPVIYGNYEGDEKAAEIMLSAKPSEWILLSEKITSEKSDFTLVLLEKVSQYYPRTLKTLKFRESAQDVLNIDIMGG